MRSNFSSNLAVCVARWQPARARLCGLLVVIVVALVLLPATATLAQTASTESGIVKAGEGHITLNLRDADIRAFIASVADLTGSNFIVDPRVKGNVTVISAAPTDVDGLYDIFLSILKVHGFAAVPSGDVIKIVPDALAKQEGQTPVPGRTVRINDALVTAVIPIRNVNAAELVAILRPLLPQEAHLAGFTSSNTLVVADTAANVRRLMDLVAELDIAGDEVVELVDLEHADAEDIVRILSAMTDPTVAQGGAPGGISPFVAYPRTNTVLVKSSPAAMPRTLALIRSLDVPDRGPDQIEVVALKFASAVDLLPVLQSVIGVTGAGTAGAAGGALGAAGQARARVAAGGPSIQADEATNTLIMQAPAQDLRRLRAVIEQLDIRRAQVLVEGIIAELSTERADELGVQWQTAQGGRGWVGGTQFAGTESGTISGAPGEEGGISLAPGLSLGYLRGVGDLRVLIRALTNDRYTNVLSTPTLMTLDNAEAEIVVGQNVPFVTGQFTNQATTPENPFQTITRQDVGVLLKVKPQINYGDTVTLELEQEVSSVDSSTSGADLITNKRAIKTTVLVDNQDIVVLGGLIEDGLRENVQKVPLLGDIPVLGQLFRNTRASGTRTNLMVFLRPSIMRDPESSRELARVRYGALRERQDSAESTRRTLLKQDSPRLPSFDGLLE